jgi:hypothetical protein
MPRFSIKDLLLAITLVAVGLSLEIALMGYHWRILWGMSLSEKILCVFLAFGAGGAKIGAGLLAPFHKKAAGGLIGLALVGSFFVLLGLLGV